MPSGKKNVTKENTYIRDGFTLVELVIYISLIGLVLAAIYNFYFFSSRSTMRTQAEAEVLQDSRNVMMQMEREIRQANRPRNLSNLPVEIDPEDLPFSNGVVIDFGTEMTIYSYIGDAPKRITYRITKAADYSIMERSVDNPHIAEPDNWQQVIKHIVTSNDQDYFIEEDSKIIINFVMMDSRGHLSAGMEISNTFTVRGKEAMQ